MSNEQFMRSNKIKYFTNILWKLKGALQSDLRMCTKEPTFYDTNSLCFTNSSTMFWVLAKPDCCFLIIYYIYSRSLKI